MKLKFILVIRNVVDSVCCACIAAFGHLNHRKACFNYSRIRRWQQEATHSTRMPICLRFVMLIEITVAHVNRERLRR
jgi:hypothetical protein